MSRPCRLITHQHAWGLRIIRSFHCKLLVRGQPQHQHQQTAKAAVTMSVHTLAVSLHVKTKACQLCLSSLCFVRSTRMRKTVFISAALAHVACMCLSTASTVVFFLHVTKTFSLQRQRIKTTATLALPTFENEELFYFLSPRSGSLPNWQTSRLKISLQTSSKILRLQRPWPWRHHMWQCSNTYSRSASLWPPTRSQFA